MLNWIQKNLNLVICGLLVMLTGLIFNQITSNNKKKVSKKKHNCFEKCRLVFDHKKNLDRQLKESKDSENVKGLIIFQALVFSSIVENKKDELCPKHYQEFKEMSVEEISLVENTSKKFKELFNYYKNSDCSCKKVLEKIFKTLNVLNEKKVELSSDEKSSIFGALLKKNKENFCDRHRNFYENF